VTKDQNEIVKNIMEMFLTFGFSKEIKTDNGMEFKNTVIKNICDTVKVKHNFIIAYNHHANGLIECNNRIVRGTITKMMKANKDEYGTHWEDLVPAVSFALNSRIH
jgi:IS30 family transposase